VTARRTTVGPMDRTILMLKGIQNPVAPGGLRLTHDRPFLFRNELPAAYQAAVMRELEDGLESLLQNCGGTDQGGWPGRNLPAIRFLTDSAVFTWRTCLWYGMQDGMAVRLQRTKNFVVVENVLGVFLTQMNAGKNGASILEHASRKDVKELVTASLPKDDVTEPFEVRFESDGFCHVYRAGSTCWRFRVKESLRMSGVQGLTFLEKYPDLRQSTVPLWQVKSLPNCLVGPLDLLCKLGERYRPSDPHRLDKLVGRGIALGSVNDTIDDLPHEELVGLKG
jgi:hypothetical protein